VLNDTGNSKPGHKWTRKLLKDHDDGGQDSPKTKRPTPTSNIHSATALESVAHRHLKVVADAGRSVTDPTTGIGHVIGILYRDTWEF